MSKEYVLVYAERTGIDPNQTEVLLVLKDRPAVQRGYYNLPGGLVEDNESPYEAAERELKEETGYEIVKELFHVGTVKDIIDNYAIHVFKTNIKSPYSDIFPRKEETEKVEWIQIHKVLKFKNLIPNLRIIIPLIRGGAVDWVIEAKLLSSYGPNHNLCIWFPTYVHQEEV